MEKEPNLLTRAWLKIKEIALRDIKVYQSAPPYILIGLLWWLSGVSDDRAREEQRIRDATQLALVEYETRQDAYTQALEEREECETQVTARQNNIDNWHGLYNSLRIAFPGEESQELIDQLQLDFDSRPNNQPLDVDTHCAAYPIPSPPIVPQILIERGLVND